MGNAGTRLIGEKQRVLLRALEELGVEPEVAQRLKTQLLPRLLDLGYEIKMRGGDRVWWASEEPPGPEEIRGWTTRPDPGVSEVRGARHPDDRRRIAELEEQLRNSEIFRRNVIREYRGVRTEIGQLLETWDNVRELIGNPAVTQERLRRRIEDLRQWGSGMLREDDDGAPYPPEVQT